MVYRAILDKILRLAYTNQRKNDLYVPAEIKLVLTDKGRRNMEWSYGILGSTHPIFRHLLGAACVFFLKKGLGDRVQRGLTVLPPAFMVAASIWSLLIPAMEQPAGVGGWGIPAGGHRLLGWYPISFGTGSSDPPPPPAKPAGGGPPHPTATLHHDGAGGHPPQYPGGNGGGGGLCWPFVRGEPDHRYGRSWPYLWASPFRTSPKGPSSLCRCVLRG